MADQDPQELYVLLSALAHWQRIAFAASCVEVLVPSYRRFSQLEQVGDADFVQNTIDSVWTQLETEEDYFDSSGVPASDQVLGLMPEEDDWNDWYPQAENAITALAYLVMLAREDNAQYAVHAAEHSYEAVDELVSRDPEPRMLNASARAELLAEHAIQAELVRQSQALEILGQPSTEKRLRIERVRQAARLGAIGGS